MEALLEYFPAKRIAMEEIPDATKEQLKKITEFLKSRSRAEILAISALGMVQTYKLID